MEHLNPGVYHRVSCAYVRTLVGQLVSCTGPRSQAVGDCWLELLPLVTSPSLQQPLAFPGAEAAATEKTPCLGESPPITKSLVHVDRVHEGGLAVYEGRQGIATEHVFGLVVQLQPPKAGQSGFDDVFASLLVQNMRLFTSKAQDHGGDARDAEARETTDKIVHLFDSWLRYAGTNDKWHSRGREYFFGCVFEFVQRRARLEFCLPAFPCKSSNQDKVFGVLPDRGEQLALEHLYSFLEAIAEVYDEGAKLWIVSDGHVFSDCIGVDDQTVDQYSEQLIKMSSAISQNRRGKDLIGFKSLVDIFDLGGDKAAAVARQLQLPALDSRIATRRTPAAELSRQMLVHSCGTDPAALRARIKAADRGALKLYRGFSRFMSEDLSQNRHTKHLSRCKLKQLASAVAFEMMQRNDAYSNLVELFFPNHVRLSIHAHDNAGPKFGIRMFGPGVRALDRLSLSAGEARSADLLHVPTPWHNCIAVVSGQSTTVMTKAKVAREALARGEFAGGWVDAGHAASAGYFALQAPCATRDAPRETLRTERERERERDQAHRDVLDCSDAANRYMWDVESAADADMVYLRASLAGVGAF